MVPMPNVIAGILIGAVNDTWLSRVLIPFGWGVIFCIFKSIMRRDEIDAFIASRGNQKAKWGMSTAQANYFIEYATATTTALFFSVIAGAVKALL
jgi:hypothetical protein